MFLQLMALALGQQLRAAQSSGSGQSFQKSWVDGFKTFAMGGNLASDTFTRSNASAD